ncbi:putative chloroperoxidase [Xylaria sp. FL1777]|nr:putative chloroperoxidase [Xylaria sp. FL1777]
MQFLAILALVTSCAAGPIVPRAALKPYVKPKSTDSRSPCPMLNTLANHGYLPHDGRNITTQDIGNAIFEATNWNADFGIFPATAALQNLKVSSIMLSDLNSTPGGEHPASLTRKDASSGDSNTIDTARIAQLLADSKTNYLTVDSVAKTRNRLDASSNPPLTASELGVAQGEAALMLLLMRDTYFSLQTSETNVSTLRAPKDRTRVWLLEEKFPTAQGWQPAAEVVQITDLGPISAAIVDSQAAQRASS